MRRVRRKRVATHDQVNNALRDLEVELRNRFGAGVDAALRQYHRQVAVPHAQEQRRRGMRRVRSLVHYLEDALRQQDDLLGRLLVRIEALERPWWRRLLYQLVGR